MMNPCIRQLPDELISRIAAGEVVERPSAVLKELIENAIDAKADKISVSLEGAGRTLLSVSDNGHGMDKDQALLSLKRHATSKINSLEDLESIMTYGFRGEALPSIASVSKFSLTTKTADAETGWVFQLEGGSLKSQKPTAREHGTSIEVRELFFNTPARYKFLKADATERSHCIRVVEEMAFCNPGIAFHLQVEKAKPIVFQAGPLINRIQGAWGGRVSEGLEKVESNSPHFQLSGLVSNPHFHQGTTRYQLLFINRRPVLNRSLVRAVYEAYQGRLPSMRHPAWVLFLDVNPQSVDVNVHPAKREVKLTHEREIFGFVLNAVKQALNQNIESVSTPFPTYGSLSSGRSYPSARESFGQAYSPKPSAASLSTVMESLYAPLQASDGGLPISLIGLKNRNLKAVAQVNKMFILSEDGQGVAIVDQHAAAERVVYEKLIAAQKNEKPQTQMLLVPFTWEVSLSLTEAVKEHVPDLQKMGFIIDPFGESAFIIKGYPSALGEKYDLHSLLDGISDVFAEGGSSKSGLQGDYGHRLAAMTACKSSVRAGDSLQIKECQAIIDQVLACESPLTCPHGRPTFVEFSYQDLERRFRRI